MQRVLLLICLLFISGCISAYPVLAQVRINEVFPNPSGPSSEPTEFIELYNPDDNDVDLSGWSLEDTSGSVSVFSIPDIKLSGKSFISFRRDQTKITLNNSGDGVVLKDTSGQSVDTVTFDQASEDKSFARVPDGQEDFFANQIPSESQTNGVPPTPTPTDLPTPTKTPTPTRTPTPTKIPTPTKKPTPTKISDTSKTPTKESTPAKTATPTEQVLGARTASTSAKMMIYPTDTPKPLQKNATQTLVASANNFRSLAFIGAGICMIVSCGILVFQKYKDKIF